MTEDRETLQKEAEAIKHRIESTRREAEQVAEHYNGQLKSLYEDLKVRDDAGGAGRPKAGTGVNRPKQPGTCFPTAPSAYRLSTSKPAGD
jgi:hypothetical protein